MRVHSGLTLVLAAVLTAGCSPYLYKTEITGFSDGLNQLDSAYVAGMKNVAGDRREKQRLKWTTNRVPLALTSGCLLSTPAQANVVDPCGLLEVNQEEAAISPEQREALAAAPILEALHDYADALASVSDAEDQKTLDAAQAQLNTSLDSLVKLEAKASGAPVGLAAELSASATLAWLNTRRYQALRTGVNAARKPVQTLGLALGNALDSLRTARVNELRIAAGLLVRKTGPGLNAESYARQLDGASNKVIVIEGLRTANPTDAAKAMIQAHDKLVNALNDDNRQIKDVLTSVKAFVDQAKSVREAFEG
ncbi:hypothetical protein [Pseudomonas izuensis]|uniref:hypothetical protein n=1 Tax=Pseudomonas izuensis TaxID=2684212 RepID=UPI00135C275D|nr:hypothetical protein [Pseudomonas izuensis]